MIDMVEVDGRIIELARQRDEALVRLVILNGELAKLKVELEQLRKQSEEKNNSSD